MFILAGVIADPALIPSHEEGISKEQLRDSSQRPAEEKNLLHHHRTYRDPQKKHKEQNITASMHHLSH